MRESIRRRQGTKQMSKNLFQCWLKHFPNASNKHLGQKLANAPGLVLYGPQLRMIFTFLKGYKQGRRTRDRKPGSQNLMFTIKFARL